MSTTDTHRHANPSAAVIAVVRGCQDECVMRNVRWPDEPIRSFDRQHRPRAYAEKGGSGFGVRLLVELASAAD